MNEATSPKGLREEWSLLLHSFLDDDNHSAPLLERIRSAEMTADQIRTVKKELSSKRKKMNQNIEKIKIKIDQVNNVIENLDLVGSDSSGLLKEIEFLNNEGEKLSEEIQTLDEKLRRLHELQDLVSL